MVGLVFIKEPELEYTFHPWVCRRERGDMLISNYLIHS